MKLSEKPTNFCRWNGKKYKLNLAFGNVLKAYEIIEDEVLLPFEKAQFFIYKICPKAYNIPLDKLLDFTNLVIKTHINSSDSSAQTGEKTVDMVEDSNYIFASFKQAYGIDLYKDTPQWSEFIALFKSLPESTKIREIMSIRARPLPTPTKYNGQEIQNLIKLKEFYALTTPNQNGQILNQGFANLFQTLKERAVV